jgi:hypothetical protein
MTFDATSREYCTVRRVRTNTPLQALALLNDEAFFEAAQALARRLLTDRAAGTTPESRAAFGFRLVTARQPDAIERARLVKLYTTELAHYRAHPDDARAVTTVKEADDTNSAASPASPASTASADSPAGSSTRSGPAEARDESNGRASSQTKPVTTPGTNAAEQAAWTIVANVLFNLDETVTKE